MFCCTSTEERVDMGWEQDVGDAGSHLQVSQFGDQIYDISMTLAWYEMLIYLGFFFLIPAETT